MSNGKMKSRGLRIALQGKERETERKVLYQQLIPGIPDALTATEIFPWLTWDTVHNLTTVSHTWLRAIRNGEVFKARVSSPFTNTVFVMRTYEGNIIQLALYSMEANSLYSLPPIPYLYNMTYTSVNGKLYVIGGILGKRDWNGGPSVMYVYDLGTHIGWRRKAIPHGLRLYDPVDCAVMNRKIFVTGGLSRHECFVYDPDVDSWSRISHDIHDPQWHQNIITGVQEELAYRYAPLYGLDHRSSKWVRQFPLLYFEHSPYSSFGGTGWPSFYSDDSGESKMDIILRGILVTFGRGTFFKMTSDGIDVFDCHTNTWIPFPLQGSFVFSNNQEKTRIDMQGASEGVPYTEARPILSGPIVWTRRVAIVSVKNRIFSLVERLDQTSELNYGINWEDHFRRRRRDIKLYLMTCETSSLGGEKDVLVQANERHDSSRIEQTNDGPGVEWTEVAGNLPMPLSEEFLRCPLQL